MPTVYNRPVLDYSMILLAQTPLTDPVKLGSGSAYAHRVQTSCQPGIKPP